MQKFLYVLSIRLIIIHEHSFLQHVDLREVTVQHQLLSATLNNVKLTLILNYFLFLYVQKELRLYYEQPILWAYNA